MPTKKIIKKKHTHYHKDGTIWAKGNMLGNKMEGKWVWYRKPARISTKGGPARNSKKGGVGTKMRSGSFKNGLQTGKWTTYSKTGQVVKVTNL